MISSTLQVIEYGKEISAENEENILNDSIEDYKTYFSRFFEKIKDEDISGDSNLNIQDKNKESEEIKQKNENKKIYVNKTKNKNEKLNAYVNIKNIKMMRKQNISKFKKVDLISKNLNPKNGNKLISTNMIKVNFSPSESSSEKNKILARKYKLIFSQRRSQTESSRSESSESEYLKLNNSNKDEKGKIF